MLQIVYISRATARLGFDGLQALHDQAAGFNVAHAITGLMLYDGISFIQAIEGERVTVAALMDRIEQDDRHTAIEYHRRASIRRRQFKDWSLEYKAADAGKGDRAFLDRVIRDTAEVTNSDIKALFVGFAALSLASRRRRP